ncbi:MAG: Pyridoxal 5'-phosphate synthase subunit PdxT [bacterium]|nr:Pyridoxal 5'-phosphate synthase subunit PdxT [bacterium]
MTTTASPIGVLALQGNVEQHTKVLESLGVPVRMVRLPADLPGLAGLVLPGGESTTLLRHFDRLGWWEPLTTALNAGLPAYGTCMGAILLAREVLPTRQQNLGVLDVVIERNAYGRQVASFEADIPMEGFGDAVPLHAHFIRAPKFVSLGGGVETMASLGADPVVVRQGKLLASTFHPEVVGDPRIHRWFVRELCGLPVLG